MQTHSQRRGFTLVEIMIVVVIIGLLAAMAMPTFNKVRLESRRKSVTNNLRQFASAAQQYMLDRSVTTVGYSQLVGSATDAYLRALPNVADEDYTVLTLSHDSTQISISSSAFDTVTFDI